MSSSPFDASKFDEATRDTRKPVNRAIAQLFAQDSAKRATLDPLPAAYYWHSELSFEGLEVRIRYTPRLRSRGRMRA
jgi:hypothetical protein